MITRIRISTLCGLLLVALSYKVYNCEAQTTSDELNNNLIQQTSVNNEPQHQYMPEAHLNMANSIQQQHQQIEINNYEAQRLNSLIVARQEDQHKAHHQEYQMSNVHQVQSPSGSIEMSSLSQPQSATVQQQSQVQVQYVAPQLPRMQRLDLEAPSPPGELMQTQQMQTNQNQVQPAQQPQQQLQQPQQQLQQQMQQRQVPVLQQMMVQQAEPQIQQTATQQAQPQQQQVPVVSQQMPQVNTQQLQPQKSGQQSPQQQSNPMNLMQYQTQIPVQSNQQRTQQPQQQQVVAPITHLPPPSTTPLPPQPQPAPITLSSYHDHSNSPLYIGHNPYIEILRPKSYADDNIVTLNLSHSHIYEIDSDAFVGQRFEHIDLSNNKLGLIHSRSFRIGPNHSRHSAYVQGNSTSQVTPLRRRPPPAHPKGLIIDFSNNPAIVALSGAFEHIDVPNCLLNFTNSTVELKFGAFKKYLKEHPGHMIDVASVDCCEQEWLLGYKHNFVARTHCEHDPNLYLSKVSQQTIIDSCISYVTSGRRSMTIQGPSLIQVAAAAPKHHGNSNTDSPNLTYVILGGTAMILTSLSIYIIFYMFSLKAAFVYHSATTDRHQVEKIPDKNFHRPYTTSAPSNGDVNDVFSDSPIRSFFRPGEETKD